MVPSQTLIYITRCLILFLVMRIHLSFPLCCFSTFSSSMLRAHLRQEQLPSEPLPAEGPAQDSGAIRFFGSIFTRLLAQNRDVFTGVLFTIRPYTPTPSVDIAACTSSYDYCLKLWMTTSSTVLLLSKALNDYFPTSTTTSSTSTTTRCLDQLLHEVVRLLEQLCIYFLDKYDHSVSRSTTSTTRTTTS
jgi:hypothetical protein